MKTMSEFWQYREEVALTALGYAAVQMSKCIVSELLLRGFEQLAIPIEAGMADEEAPYGDVS